MTKGSSVSMKFKETDVSDGMIVEAIVLTNQWGCFIKTFRKDIEPSRLETVHNEIKERECSI